MEIRQLRYFLALAEREHVSITAENLYISQSALSKSIASLEKELGVPLFDHCGNRIHLNDYGRSFARTARETLNVLNQGQMNLHRIRYDVCGELRICCHVFPQCITDCLNAYTNLNPRVRLTIYLDYSRSVSDVDFLLGSNNEAAILSDNVTFWNSLPLFSEHFGVFLAPSLRAFPEQTETVSIQDLRDCPFVLSPDFTSFFPDLTTKLCEASGFKPNVTYRTNDFLTALRFVSEGKTAAILPECIRNQAQRLAPQVRFFYLKENPPARMLYLIHRRESQLTETAQDFLNFAADYYHAGET